MLTNKVWYVRLESREKGGGTRVVVGGRIGAVFTAGTRAVTGV